MHAAFLCAVPAAVLILRGEQVACGGVARFGRANGGQVLDEQDRRRRSHVRLRFDLLHMTDSVSY